MENGSDDLQTSAGSYYYYSPEACLGSTYKGKKSDIWACGVTLYFMIYKQHPWEDNVIPNLFKKIQTEEPSYRPKKQDMVSFSVSPQLKELMKNILTKNPENRITIGEIKEHPWITQNGVDPMPDLDKQQIQASEDEIQNAISKVTMFGKVLLKKIAASIQSEAKTDNESSPHINLLASMMKSINEARNKQQV